MKDNISHRSEDDTQWQETKEKCRKRDKNMCAICRMLTPGEYMVFMKSHPAYIQTIDVAHIESVGTHLEKTYDLSNIVCLCRCHHSRMDSMQDPITGKRMTSEKHTWWWDKIKKFLGI